MKNILVTGGAGFIGLNFIRYILQVEPDLQIVNLDTAQERITGDYITLIFGDKS
jgi:dTDP-D-glucose 4,6-dehydratase